MFDNESDRPSHHIPNKPVLPTPRANFFRNSGVPTLRSMQTTLNSDRKRADERAAAVGFVPGAAKMVAAIRGAAGHGRHRVS